MSDKSQPASREDLVAQAINTWRVEFQDLAAMPSLRRHAHPDFPQLDITNAHPAGLAKLMAQGRAHLSEVVREVGAQATARKAASEIQNQARNWAEEYGLFTTYLGVGEATWVPLSGRPAPAMPVLVRPAEMQYRDAAREDLDLWLHPATEVNPELLRALNDVGVYLDPEELVELTRGPHGFDPMPVINTLRALGEPLPGFTVRQRLVISNIVDVGPALLDELSTGAYRLQRHPVIAAIAGDAGAQQAVKKRHKGLSAEVLRELEDHLVLDADPDAAKALNLARGGSHVAISAPAGTQGIETILNLVSTQVAAGRKVLVVTPQRKQLEALSARAAELGLDELMLNLGPSPQSQIDARATLAHSLTTAHEEFDETPRESLSELHRCAKRLNDHARAVRTTRIDLGVSLLDCMEKLAQITAREDAPASTILIGDEFIEPVSRQRHQIVTLLMKATDLGAFAPGVNDTPWYGAPITSRESADAALATLATLKDDLLPKVREAVAENGRMAGLTPVDTLGLFAQRLDMLDDMKRVLADLRPEAFETDPSQLIIATATKEWRQERRVDMSLFQRRKLAKQAQELLRPLADPTVLHSRLVEVQAHRELWQRYSSDSSYPKIPEELGSARETLEATRSTLRTSVKYLPKASDLGDIDRMPFDEIEGLVSGLLEDAGALDSLPERNQLVLELEALGLTELCADLAARNVTADQVGDEFALVWWSSAMQYIATRESSLGELSNRDKLTQVASDFRVLDEHHIRNGKHRVRATARTLLHNALAEHGELDATAQRTLTSLQRTSLRDLLVRFAPVLTAARPCWLVSPYLVPQLVPTRALGQLEKPMFDVVILADVGLMSDAAAVAAMSRAQQVIAIGDPHQVVPAHLNRATPARSALDTCREIMPHVSLTRSRVCRSGAVQEFVQKHLFAGELSNVPSPFTGDADQLMFVNDRGGAQISLEGMVESSQSELQLLGSIILQHAKHYPEKTLAVVTLTESHAARVMEHVLHRVALRHDVSAFFNPARREPFTVVAAAHAASLERDSVIFSVGFTKSPHRRVVYRLGPLTSENGRQALSLALTRARANTLVISSLRGEDFDDEKIKYQGVADLKAFLLFMEARYRQDVAAEPDESDEPVVSVGEVGAQVPELDATDVDETEAANRPEPAVLAGTTENDGVTESAGETEKTGASGNSEPSPTAESSGIVVQGLHETKLNPTVEAATARADINTVAHRVQSGRRSSELAKIDPLLSDLADRLWFSGLVVETQFGEGEEQVALALGSPEIPGRLLVAVEPDTRARPLSRSVRERDRLRLERLENAGWHVERIWAWPLFLDPKMEAERLKTVVAKVVADMQKPVPVVETPELLPDQVDRGPKPTVPDSTPLSELEDGLWDRMLVWILSDGEPRMEETLANELRREMGFIKRGVHIDIAVYETIRRYQASLEPQVSVPPSV